MTVEPIDLFSSSIHLDDDGGAHAEPKAFDLDRAGWQIKGFHVETDAEVHADHYEVHPDAEEIVYCVNGAIRVYFRPDLPGEAEDEVKLPAGHAVIVPRGRWHRIELDGPSDIMSVAVARGSRLEKA